jgi:hypothetical protein
MYLMEKGRGTAQALKQWHLTTEPQAEPWVTSADS